MEFSNHLSANILKKMMVDFHQIYENITEKVIGEEDINVNQFYILKNLKSHGEILTIELANLLKISQPAVTQYLNKLVSLNYIGKKRHPEDKRRTLFVLTSQGEEKLKYLEEKQLSIIEEVLDNMEGGKSLLLIEGFSHFISTWHHMSEPAAQ